MRLKMQYIFNIYVYYILYIDFFFFKSRYILQLPFYFFICNLFIKQLQAINSELQDMNSRKARKSAVGLYLAILSFFLKVAVTFIFSIVLTLQWNVKTIMTLLLY